MEFVEQEIPQKYFPEGGNSREPWPFLFYSNLIKNFTDEIIGEAADAQGDFAQGALVQRTINAFERSYRERKWINFDEVQGA